MLEASRVLKSFFKASRNLFSTRRPRSVIFPARWKVPRQFARRKFDAETRPLVVFLVPFPLRRSVGRGDVVRSVSSSNETTRLRRPAQRGGKLKARARNLLDSRPRDCTVESLQLAMNTRGFSNARETFGRFCSPGFFGRC